MRSPASARAHEGPGFRVTIASNDAPPPVAVPASTVEAVFSALLDNACQASAYRIEIEVHPRTGPLEIAVTDNGRGIAPADAGECSNPSSPPGARLAARGWGWRSRCRCSGAGGGRLSLDRSVESGSRFLVVLPLAHAAT